MFSSKYCKRMNTLGSFGIDFNNFFQSIDFGVALQGDLVLCI